MAPFVCHACGKSGGPLLRCGRCKSAWLCNRDCQRVAVRERGHKGENCCPTDGTQSTQSPPASANPRAAPVDREELLLKYHRLVAETGKAQRAGTRVGFITATENSTAAAAVAQEIGGAEGAFFMADAQRLLSNIFIRTENQTGAARAACSALRAATVSGSRTALTRALTALGNVAEIAPGEIVMAATESREQERRALSPYHGLDLSQEGLVSLVSTPAAFFRLGLSFHEAAVSTCEVALAAAGGLTADHRLVHSPHVQAQARARLGMCLFV